MGGKLSKDTLDKVLSGLSDRNIRFDELGKLLLSLDFNERVKGDHHIFFKSEFREIINIQPLKDGKANAYQVKQVRNLILTYKLHRGVQDV